MYMHSLLASVSHWLAHSLTCSLTQYSLSTPHSLTHSLLTQPCTQPPTIHLSLLSQWLILFGELETHSCLHTLCAAKVRDPSYCPRESVMMQALAAVVQKATKRNADKGSKPRRSKKRKGSEMTGTVRADSSSQPEAAAEGQPLQDGLMQWGGKQKRKHTKQASCGLPDQAHRASQQRLLRPYFATPPAVAHPSEGNFPAATPPVAESPDDLCHAKG